MNRPDLARPASAELVLAGLSLMTFGLVGGGTAGMVGGSDPATAAFVSRLSATASLGLSYGTTQPSPHCK